MWSRVLQGCLRSELFHFLEKPNGSEGEYEVTHAGGHSMLSSARRVGELEPFCTFETSAGGSYFLKAGVIHRAAAVERPCITMLTTQERNIPIFAYGDQRCEPPFERRQANAKEAAQLAELLGSIAPGVEAS
jgi:hypothetical protein